jgi:hypothetical protein
LELPSKVQQKVNQKLPKEIYGFMAEAWRTAFGVDTFFATKT